MIRVTGPLRIWAGDTQSWHFLLVPEEISDEIRAHSLMSPRGFRSVKVEACINGIVWRTSIFPTKSGGYFLPVRTEVRREAAIAEGDEVTVRLQLL